MQQVISKFGRQGFYFLSRKLFMDSFPYGEKSTPLMDKTNQHNESPHLTDLYRKNQLLKSDRKLVDNNDDKDFPWINIEEEHAIQLILEAFIEPVKKKILNLTMEKVLTVPEILEICEIPRTSGYREINFLKKNGLLIKSFNRHNDARKICKYRSIFENIKINIEKDKVFVCAKFAKA
jgi:hypothetical protein